ncbi:MAG: hypothetical protein RR922_04985 [Clostridia bacterium]
MNLEEKEIDNIQAEKEKIKLKNKIMEREFNSRMQKILAVFAVLFIVVCLTIFNERMTVNKSKKYFDIRSRENIQEVKIQGPEEFYLKVIAADGSQENSKGKVIISQTDSDAIQIKAPKDKYVMRKTHLDEPLEKKEVYDQYFEQAFPVKKEIIEQLCIYVPNKEDIVEVMLPKSLKKINLEIFFANVCVKNIQAENLNIMHKTGKLFCTNINVKEILNIGVDQTEVTLNNINASEKIQFFTLSRNALFRDIKTKYLDIYKTNGKLKIYLDKEIKEYEKIKSIKTEYLFRDGEFKTSRLKQVKVADENKLGKTQIKIELRESSSNKNTKIIREN